MALAIGAGLEQPQGILTAAGQEASCPGAPMGPLALEAYGTTRGQLLNDLLNNLLNNWFF